MDGAEEVRRSVEATLTWREAATSAAAVDDAMAAAAAIGTEAIDGLRRADAVVFSGAGSSYYLAQSAAWAWREIVGRPAQAVPLSELLLRPDVAVDRRPETLAVVVISRSGMTSEAVDAARWARQAGATTVGLTCRAMSPLIGTVDHALVATAGDEAAIVMTRSFTSMLSGILGVAARVSGKAPWLDRMASLPGAFTAAADLASAGNPGEAWHLAAEPWSRAVILGGGARLGIAREACLKIIETSQLESSAYEPLEFRHGPISVCEPGVLVVGLLGDSAADEERRVLDECAMLGATTWLPDPGPGLHPLVRLPLLLPPLQALALGIAIRRGRDPDRPRHLTQVVVLS